MTTDHASATLLAAAARSAGLAPSVHNTQPWRWRVLPDRLELYADRRRQLEAADPEGRLLTLSCGAALDHARVALAAEGWEAAVERLPAASDPDLLAVLRPAGHAGVTTEAMRRYQAMLRRRTDRRTVTDRPVPQAALAAVRAAVEAHRSNLHLLRPEQVSELAVAAAQADDQTVTQPALQAELAYWVGGAHPPGTGVPEPAIPREAPRTHVPLRDFGHPGELEPGEGTDRAATYGVLFGTEDTPAGWLRGGEALSAGWLTATELGVAVLPFSAMVEAPATRAALLRLLSALGQPYLVLRLGLADPEHPGPPATERLDAAQTVEVVA